MRQTKSYDYVVIGSGAAGSVVAARLSEDKGTSVLVLEAGPTDLSIYIRMPGALGYPLMNKKWTWGFDTGPEPNMDDREIHHVRGRILGGSSSINGMVYVRGNARDFDEWASEGLTGWSYAHCLPYFKKLESFDGGADAYRGGDGPVRITSLRAEHALYHAYLEAGQQYGLSYNKDYNGRRQEGIHRYQANIDHGVRASSARAYLRPAMRQRGVELRLNAMATRIRFDGSGRAVGVEYESAGTSQFVEAHKEVVVSGGAYCSPHILMLSGVGDGDHLREHGIDTVAHVPAVGRHLEDHPAVPIAYAASRTGVSPAVNMNLVKMGLIGAQWLFARRGLGASNLWETGAFFRSSDDAEHPDMQHEFLPMLGDFISGDLRVTDGFQFSTCLMRPKSQGHVRLRSADPRQHPEIVHNYLNHPEDRRILVAGVKRTDEIAHQRAWDEFRGTPQCPSLRRLSDDEVLTWLKSVAGTQYHPSCSCRMGIGEDSAVDAEGRVHGVTGLRVVDASVMRHVTSGNLQCPTLMVAEKLADCIRGRTLEPEHRPSH
ncbi:MAG: choline dehydrogenase [Rhizobiaceae bacterium]